MNKKFCGFLGIVLSATTGALGAYSINQPRPSTEKNGYFWGQDGATKEHRQKPPGPSAGLNPEVLRALDETPCISNDPGFIQDLLEAKDDFALAIFTVNNCLACAFQKQILMEFNKLYGWKIKEFNAQEHTKLVNVFNISSAPTILLLRRFPAQWVQLSKGRLPFSDIEKTVAHGVRLMRGWDKS